MRYETIQRSPLMWILGAIGTLQVWAGCFQPMPFQAAQILCGSGICVLLVGVYFSRLTVRDEGDQLAVFFGPVPLFGLQIPYAEVKHFAAARTTIWDGWGLKYLGKGHWLYNIWGFDCVEIQLPNRRYRIGTADPTGLVAFLTEACEG